MSVKISGPLHPYPSAPSLDPSGGSSVRFETDPRDEIWQIVYETYFRAYFEEVAADSLADRWQWVDDLVKVFVALFASGAVGAGVAADAVPYLWSGLAGMASVMSIIHASLAVPDRIRAWSEIKHDFLVLRIDLEALRSRMKVHPDFAVDESLLAHEKLQQRYGEAYKRVRSDVLRSRRFLIKSHRELERRIASEIGRSEIRTDRRTGT